MPNKKKALPKGNAGQRYSRTIEILIRQLNRYRASQKNFNEQEYARIEGGLIRAVALQALISSDPAGLQAIPSEEKLNQLMNEARHDPEVMGAVRSALTDTAAMDKFIEALQESIAGSRPEESAGAGERMIFPIVSQLKNLPVPTIQTRMNHVLARLKRLDTDVEKMDRNKRAMMYHIVATTYVLKEMMMDRMMGINTPITEAMIAQNLDQLPPSLKLEAAIQVCGSDTRMAKKLKEVVEKPETTAKDIFNVVNRIANGPVSRMIINTISDIQKMPEDMPVVQETDKADGREKLVRLAALNLLKHNRTEMFPDWEFAFDDVFSEEEIQEAMNRVRADLFFMEEVEKRIGNTGQIRKAARDMAATRYDETLERIKEKLPLYKNEKDPAKRRRMANSFKRDFAELTALHRLQDKKYGLNTFVSDQMLEDEMGLIALDDTQIAIDRLIDQNLDAPEFLINTTYKYQGKALDLAFKQNIVPLTQYVPKTESKRGSIEYIYENFNKMLSLPNLSQSEAGRKFIRNTASKILDLRQQALSSPEGAQAKYISGQKMNLNQDITDILEHAERDAQAAQELLNALKEAPSLDEMNTPSGIGPGGEDPLLKMIGEIKLPPQRTVPEARFERDPLMKKYQETVLRLHQATAAREKQGEHAAGNYHWSKYTRDYTEEVCNAIACLNLASAPDYDKTLKKAAVAEEVKRLKEDPEMLAVIHTATSDIRAERALVDGLMTMQDDPVRMKQFLKTFGTDWAAAQNQMAADYPKGVRPYIPEEVLCQPKSKSPDLPVLKAFRIKDDKFPIILNTDPQIPPCPLTEFARTVASAKSNVFAANGAANTEQMKKDMAKLYVLRRMIATQEDPRAPIQNMNERVDSEVDYIMTDPAFERVLTACEKDPGVAQKIMNAFEKSYSFTALSDTLQAAADDAPVVENPVEAPELDQEEIQVRPDGPVLQANHE